MEELLPLENEKVDERFEIFSKENLGSVRTVLLNGEAWFCIKDVCDILEIKNPSDIPKRLEEDEVHRFNLGSRSGITNFTSESGLYALILRSKKPCAKPFRKWITSEVIPSIRKTGSYSLEYRTPKSYIEALEFLLASEKEKERLAIENKQKDQLIAEYEPKATYCDLVLASPNAVPITLIAKDYGMSAIAFNKLLHCQTKYWKKSRMNFHKQQSQPMTLNII